MKSILKLKVVGSGKEPGVIEILRKIKRNPEPLSQLVKKQIIDYIKQQQLTTNDKLPSESQLSELLGVSRTTVREAYTQLIQEGIIYRIQGKGTFLKRNPIELQSGIEVFHGVTEIIRRFLHEPGTEYLDVKVEFPDEETQEKLRISEHEQIVTYYRKRYADDAFAVYSISRVPIKYFKGEIPKTFPEESMLCYFEKYLGYTIESAVAEVTPVILDRETAHKLNISEKTLFILLKQLIFDSFGTPLIYSWDYFNSEIFKFTIVRRRSMHG